MNISWMISKLIGLSLPALWQPIVGTGWIASHLRDVHVRVACGLGLARDQLPLRCRGANGYHTEFGAAGCPAAFEQVRIESYRDTFFAAPSCNVLTNGAASNYSTPYTLYSGDKGIGNLSVGNHAAMPRLFKSHAGCGPREMPLYSLTQLSTNWETDNAQGLEPTSGSRKGLMVDK